MSGIWKEIFNLIKARSLSSKKIRVNEPELERNLKCIICNLILFCNLDDFDTNVYSNFMSLSDIKVLNEFVPFISPSSVRYYSGDQKTVDLLMRWDLEKEKSNLNYKFELNYNDFLNSQIYFRGLFKKDISSDITDLSSIKTSKSLSDVISYACFAEKISDSIDSQNNSNDEDSMVKEKEDIYDYQVKYESEPYVPIILDDIALQLFRVDYCNANYSDIISDYFNKVRYS